MPKVVTSLYEKIYSQFPTDQTFHFLDALQTAYRCPDSWALSRTQALLWNSQTDWKWQTGIICAFECVKSVKGQETNTWTATENKIHIRKTLDYTNCKNILGNQFNLQYSNLGRKVYGPVAKSYQCMVTVHSPQYWNMGFMGQGRKQGKYICGCCRKTNCLVSAFLWMFYNYNFSSGFHHLLGELVLILGPL